MSFPRMCENKIVPERKIEKIKSRITKVIDINGLRRRKLLKQRRNRERRRESVRFNI